MLFVLTMAFPFVVLVFVFKQKTAYEMRISDWSSDVCSSDLRLFPRPPPSEPHAHRFGALCQGNSDAAHADDADPGARHRPGQHLRAGCPPIGRASWRERVCQYV